LAIAGEEEEYDEEEEEEYDQVGDEEGGEINRQEEEEEEVEEEEDEDKIDVAELEDPHWENVYGLEAAEMQQELRLAARARKAAGGATDSVGGDKPRLWPPTVRETLYQEQQALKMAGENERELAAARARETESDAEGEARILELIQHQKDKVQRHERAELLRMIKRWRKHSRQRQRHRRKQQGQQRQQQLQLQKVLQAMMEAHQDGAGGGDGAAADESGAAAPLKFQVRVMDANGNVHDLGESPDLSGLFDSDGAAAGGGADGAAAEDGVDNAAGGAPLDGLLNVLRGHLQVQLGSLVQEAAREQTQAMQQQTVLAELQDNYEFDAAASTAAPAAANVATDTTIDAGGSRSGGTNDKEEAAVSPSTEG